MQAMTKLVETFPSVSLYADSGSLPVEVTLIAQLGHGAGNHLFASVVSRQRRHRAFVDELDEPSAKLAGTDFAKGDATALYSFAVGPRGHPFHRHAGHRIFTAISGSGGAQLRFSNATSEQIAADPACFVRALRNVNIPPDCLFTVRFGDGVWHQFAPLRRRSLHPVFFALSCHTNELGGALPETLRQKVLAGAADIPTLTELLPPAVAALLEAPDFKHAAVPTTSLSLDAPEGTLHRLMCNVVRCGMGMMRGTWAAWREASGYFSETDGLRARNLLELPPDSLLRQHLTDVAVHEDAFSFTVNNAAATQAGATQFLAAVLEGFLLNPPPGVGWLMAVRNFLVRPLGLRTSPLGCPVSSLLAEQSSNLFGGQYPVIDQRVSADDTLAQVVLGADDKHLRFRSSVSARLAAGDQIEVVLATRVCCTNAFGRFYMACISAVHRRYIAPTMLRMAVTHALQARSAVAGGKRSSGGAGVLGGGTRS